jgi:MFS family permease
MVMSNRRLRDLAFTSLAHFVNDGTVFFVPVIAALVANLKEASPLELTVMFVVFYGSATIPSLYVGRSADRSGNAGALLGVGILLLSLGLLGYYVTLETTGRFLFLVSLLIAALLAGFGSAFYHPLGASVLQSSFNDAERGRALGVNGAIASVGRAIYPITFFLVALSLSTAGSIVFFALAGILASVSVWLGLRPRDRHVPNRDDAGEVAGAARRSLTTGIVLLTLVSFIRSLATTGIYSWIPIYMSNQKGLGVTSALGFDWSLMLSAAIVGQPLFGYLTDKFDRRVVLAISSVGSAMSILAYLYTTGVAELLMLALFGFFTFTAFPLLLALASNYETAGSSSLSNALVWGLGTSGGSVIGPLITGALTLADYNHLRYAFEVMAVGAIISAALTLLLPNATAVKRAKT